MCLQENKLILKKLYNDYTRFNQDISFREYTYLQDIKYFRETDSGLEILLEQEYVYEDENGYEEMQRKMAILYKRILNCTILCRTSLEFEQTRVNELVNMGDVSQKIYRYWFFLDKKGHEYII